MFAKVSVKIKVAYFFQRHSVFVMVMVKNCSVTTEYGWYK